MHSPTIGIITVHDIPNYGSILQALATQRLLEKLGAKPELIDYQYPNPIHDHRTPLQKARAAVLARCNAFLKDCLPGRKYRTYNLRYKSFKEKHYRLSAKRYPTAESLIADPPTYDLYLAGSDQIWRPQFVKDDPIFFLNFAPKDARLVSYASSFGCLSIPEQYRETYKRYLGRFAHLAVREAPGRQIIGDLLGRDAEVVLDPTLMLDREEWADYLTPPPTDEPYILCYGLAGGNRYMEELAMHIAGIMGYRVIRLNGKFFDYFNRRITFVLDAGPAEWLGYFAHAAFVLGQSFHATAFATNFRRPFFSLLRGDPDHDSRQRNILSILGLEHRAITMGDPFPARERIEEAIDFEKAHANLAVERKRSLIYLKSAIEHP